MLTSKAAVLGAGECFRKMLPGLRSEFMFEAIFDPKPPPSTLELLTEQEHAVLVDTEQDFFTRAATADALFILSPPSMHVRQLEASSLLGIPVFVEKPLAVDREDLLRLEASLTCNPRVYFSDFFVDVRGALLCRAFGKRMPETEWIVPHSFAVSGKPDFDQIRAGLGNVERICGRLLEGVGTAKRVDSRPWLMHNSGGGVLLDLTYHYLALYWALFDSPLTLHKLRLGVHQGDQNGYRFTSWDPAAKLAETYAFTSFRSAEGFMFEMEVAKNWTHDCRDFVITGSRGSVSMDFGSSRELKNVLYTDLHGIKASIAIDQKYWNLVTKGFVDYVRATAALPYDAVLNRNFDIGKKALIEILNIKDIVQR